MLQIGGIASGLDTQALIDQLMQVESRPLTLWKQQQQQLEQKATAWKDIQGRLSSLRSRINDLTDLTLFEQRAARSSDEQVATAQAAAGATPVWLSVEVTRLATVHRLAGLHMTDTRAAVGAAGDLSVTVAGTTKTATIAGTDSLAAIRDKLNGLGLDVRASLIDGTLVIEGTKTGASQQISFSDDTNGTLLTALKLSTDQVQTLQAPQDASFLVNGLALTSPTNTSTTVSDGLTLNLVGVGQARVDVAANEDEVVRRIRAFVDQYNSTFGLMQEKSAKGALLQGDVGLIRLVTNLRWKTMSPVTGTLPAGQISLLSQIGVSVDRSGTMSLDESKLRQQLADQPNAVRLLLQASSATDGFTGVMRSLAEYVGAALDPTSGVTASSQKAAQSRIDELDRQMEAFQQRLDRRREGLVRQFSALEQVINTLQSQSTWLAGQLKQLGGGTSK